MLCSQHGSHPRQCPPHFLILDITLYIIIIIILDTQVDISPVNPITEVWMQRGVTAYRREEGCRGEQRRREAFIKVSSRVNYLTSA